MMFTESFDKLRIQWVCMMSQNNTELNRPGHSCKLLCTSQVILGADMDRKKYPK